VAEPARRPLREEPPPLDPSAVDRAYRVERARRRARAERERAAARARLRFLAVLVVLAALALVLVVADWREVQRLFGI
jgi:hypothetical protein